MPVTPYHFGPALGFGLPLRKYLHLPTFIVANVIVDLEPFLVLALGLRYPLHGYLHTYVSAFFLGIVVGSGMFLLEPYFSPLYKAFLLKADNKLKWISFVLAGVLGIMLHVTLDSPLYSDIRPFYPLTANPFFRLDIASQVYSFCVWMGLIGILFYAGLLILSVYRKFRRK